MSDLCSDRSMFEDLKLDHLDEIHLVNSATITNFGTGTGAIEHEYGKITLLNVLYVSELQGKFISVSKVISVVNKVTLFIY